jgi:hypothetical protein
VDLDQLAGSIGVAAVGCDDEGQFLRRHERFGVAHDADL